MFNFSNDAQDIISNFNLIKCNSLLKPGKFYIGRDRTFFERNTKSPNLNDPLNSGMHYHNFFMLTVLIVVILYSKSTFNSFFSDFINVETKYVPNRYNISLKLDLPISNNSLSIYYQNLRGLRMKSSYLCTNISLLRLTTYFFNEDLAYRGFHEC